MTPSPHCVGVEDSLLLAIALMQRYDIRHLPVIQGERLAGILTDREVKRALDPDLRLPPKEELFVGDVFTPGGYVVDGETPLDRVLERMATDHIGSVLVTANGQLAGVFTMTDACRVLCQHLRTTAAHADRPA